LQWCNTIKSLWSKNYYCQTTAEIVVVAAAAAAATTTTSSLSKPSRIIDFQFNAFSILNVLTLLIRS
jgi:hypothetical protein